MAENLKIPASVDLEIRQAEAKAKVLADKVSASFQKIKIGGFDSSGLKAGSAALGRIRHDADQFTKSMEAANARVLAFGTAVGVIEGMRRSFLALVKTTVDVEKALTQISVVAGDNFAKAGMSIEQFGQQIFQTAKLTGQSFDITSKAALEFSRQGLGIQETLKRTRDALILSRISGTDYKQVVDGLTSTLNAFKQSGLDSTTAINKLVAVDNNAAASLTDLIEGLNRSASVAQLTGQSFDQTVASIATLQEITSRGGAQIGNSLKSIFTRLYDEDSLKFLQEFQGGVVKIRDDVGNLIPAIEIMRNLGNAIKDLPKEQQLNILKDISGLYQVNAAAALAGQGLQELNKQKSIYDKNLATSQGAKDNALTANATLAELLSAKLNTLDIQLGEVLNSLGKIGVKNPLSSLLDSFIETGDFIQGIVEGTDKFSQLIQGIGRGIGGALFSPAVFGAIAIAIGKIGVNFASFAISAGKTFLGLNRASQEQAAIQKSITAYIQQSGANLSNLLTSESARLNLAKQISAEWAKQAVYSKQVNGVAQVVAGSVYSSGLRAGETGPTLSKKGLRSAEGYLPDLVSGEMSDIKKGVGGASSNSKVVVMPNFPLGGGNKGLMVANSSESVVNLGGGKFGVLNQDMMGKRAAGGFISGTVRRKAGVSGGGQFIEKTVLENALSLMINAAIASGKSSKELSAVINKTIGGFELGREAFARVSKEANAFGQGLLKQTKQLESLKAGANAYSQSTSNPAQLPAIPYAGLGFMGSTSVKSSSSFGSFAPSGQALLNISERQRQSNSIYGNVGSANSSFYNEDLNSSPDVFGVTPKKKQQSSIYGNIGSGNSSFYGGNLNSAPDVFGVAGKESSSSLQSQAKKGIDPEALQNLAIKAVIATSVLDGLTSSLLRGTKEGDKVADLFSTLATSGFAFQGLNQLKGIGASDIFGEKLVGKVDGFLGSGGGGVGGALKKATSGLLSFGGGLLKFLPVIGQGALALTVLNDAIEVVTGKSGFQRLKEAFGGLTIEAEKSAQAFKDNAEFLFDASGKAILRAPKEIQGRFQSKLADARKEREAKTAGIDTEGKNKQQVSNELLGKKLDDLLSGTKTGATSIGYTNRGQNANVGVIYETLGNIDSSITTVVKENLQQLSNQTEDGLREFLSSKGVSKINGEDIRNSGLDKLQDEVNRLFLENIVKNIEPIKRSIGTGRERELVSALGEKFLNIPKTRQVPSINDGRGPINTFNQNFTSSLFKDFPFVQKKKEFDFPRGPLKSKTSTGAPSQESIQKFFEIQKEIELLAFDASAANIESQIKGLESSLSSSTLSSKNRNEIENQVSALQSAVLAGSLVKLGEEAKVSIGKVNSDTELSLLEKDSKIKQINTQLGIEETKIKADIKSIGDSYLARNREFSAIQKLIPAIDSATNTLTSLSISRSQTEADLSLLQAKASNPANEILQNEDYQRKIADKERNLLVNSLETASAEFNSRNLEISSLPKDQQTPEQIKAIAALGEQVIAINGQIAALDESTRQIGTFGNVTQKFADSILEFERGLGENRAQNQLGILQATDKSSIVGGLIGEQSFDAVQGKTGTDLVSSLSEQNAIRQQQFDIATASSKVEKLNLETELALNQEIFEIRNSNLSAAEKQSAIENAINANLSKHRSFGFGVSESLSGMQDEVNSFGNTFGKTATDGFRDGLVSAMQAASNATGNLKDSLLNVALEFSNKLRDAAINNLANIVTTGLSNTGVGSAVGSFLGGMFGGGAKKFSTGGFVSAGSKSVDDVPALLKKGEFVMNQGAVQNVGRSNLEAANNGSFAPGVYGQGKLSGKDQLLSFATQTATGGKNDLIRSLAGGGGLAALEPESGRLSNFARFGDSPIVQATQEVKDQALGLYFQQMEEEKAFAEQLAQEKKAQKEAIKGMILNLAISAGTGLISKGLGSLSTKSSKEISIQKGSFKMRKASESPFGDSFKATAYGNSSIDPTTARDQKLADAGVKGYTGFSQTVGASGRSLVPGYSVASNKFPLGTRLSIGGKEFRVDDRGGMSKNIIDFYAGNNKSLYRTFANLGRISPVVLGRNSGGAISGAGDQVPIMASKKEFMINAPSAQKIGFSNLDSMNKGFSPSGEDNSAVVARLDELIQKTQASNEIKIEISVSSSGESSGSTSAENENSKALGEKLHSVIVQALKQEQRPGGVLYKPK